MKQCEFNIVYNTVSYIWNETQNSVRIMHISFLLVDNCHIYRLVDNNTWIYTTVESGWGRVEMIANAYNLSPLTIVWAQPNVTKSRSRSTQPDLGLVGSKFIYFFFLLLPRYPLNIYHHKSLIKFKASSNSYDLLFCAHVVIEISQLYSLNTTRL